ncbi:phosphotransferase [Embleya sp. NPDC059237]|uniref:phosphotransferase n=1 Tax=Embleya sp. NPDC059237 TaxID=3346784 RepID=UPI00367A75A5
MEEGRLTRPGSAGPENEDVTVDPLLAAAVEALGVTEPPAPLSPHHTHAWRTADWKIRTADDPTAAAALLHEARAVRLLSEAKLTSHTGAYARVGTGAWTALAWSPGTTLWEWCAAHRDDPADAAPRLRRIADRAFALLRRWHAAGWRHGDLHPGNVLIGGPDDDVEFIDFELTHHRELLPLPGPYRGGGDQATAPEIARLLLTTAAGVDLELTDAAEVYSLGATLRWAWTGAGPATPRFVGPRVTPTDVLEDIVGGRRRVPLTEARPWADRRLEALIEDTMALDPCTRSRTASHRIAGPGGAGPSGR